ncbi:NADH-quinone oxidoreductase subunit J [Prosthecobacter debontii]|uniref:NADH-quinone oxidoreductase subunit J n=1 Tax=Prosthecobacter debontii TaxID=48467 RepID=A0A1T4YAT4_9BACT|nr:NADH-quinone oxidoreductase subunit J [Prosthecobacter debontii]SKA98638.1 NADH-quinone oxidoreductase subunit J [Prosthecobacter debontii]
MPSILFYLFAAITLGFGLLVVTARNPVTSALSLAMSFVGLAALFLSLDAYFIGIIQILVYAGAVMVLFLFIIMLMDIKAEEGKAPNLPAIAGGIVLAAILALQVATVCSSFDAGSVPLKDAALNLEQASTSSSAKLATISNDLKAGVLPDAKLMGLNLFHKYGFHLQVVGLLLLVGTIGVVVLSKREKGVKDA